jgi:hypothetical protein
MAIVKEQRDKRDKNKKKDKPDRKEATVAPSTGIPSSGSKPNELQREGK